VLKAHDPALNRFVAIKVLSGDLASRGPARRRYAREAQAAAAVVHDHIVPIHAVDAAGKVPFLVMAYVHGKSLQDRIDEPRPIEIREVLRISLQIAAGLAAAHAQGLVHRDIKPGNILLENGVERVKITDFGLARAVDDASLTHSGVIAGTPEYMSPEQARGETVDHRTDLFSLGSVMYAMLAGHSPFRAPSMMAVLHRVCTSTPRDIRECNPDVPGDLAAIVRRLLAKSPAKRFASAAELCEELENRLARWQQPGRSAGRFARSMKRVWRRDTRSTLTWLVVPAAVCAALGLGAWRPWQRDDADAGAIQTVQQAAVASEFISQLQAANLALDEEFADVRRAVEKAERAAAHANPQIEPIDAETRAVRRLIEKAEGRATAAGW
jgi:serine/threonine-protein kinase